MSDGPKRVFNPPPGWPQPPKNWSPPLGWSPDPSWPKPPEGWQLWVESDSSSDAAPQQAAKERHASGDAAPTGEAPASQLLVLEAQNASLRRQLETLASQGSLVNLDDERVLQDVGVYRYHHPLENAVAYQAGLGELSQQIAALVKADAAIQKSDRFTLDGSLAKGRQMTRDLGRLMLRAYNAEAENVIRTMRLGTVQTAKKRLEATRNAIAGLGALMEMRISDEYHSLRVREIELTADYLVKKEEEREAEREERERLREERRVARELAEAREKLEKERAHIASVLEKLRSDGKSDSALEQSLAEVEQAIVQNDFRSANIRAGYVYVISNRGAFGGNVVKIGLTRRLEPSERILELGDASVPFRFDVHAIYFSEDAVSLENSLHAEFSKRRVNWVNDRREFFFATPSEVRAALERHTGNLLEFVEHADSTEFLQSRGSWPSEFRRE